MTAKTRTAALAIVAAIASVAAACRNDHVTAGGASTLTSLDNLTRAEGAPITVNHCGIDMSEARFAAMAPEDRAVLEATVRVDGDDRAALLATAGALTAVPKAMQKALFMAKGRIRVTADAAALCAGAKAADTEERMDGCWRLADDHVEIVLRPELESIHHALLRLFALVYDQFLVDRLLKLDDVAVAPELRQALIVGAKRLRAQATHLTTALHKDLGREGLDGGPELESRVLAEAVDSAYCSQATRKTFEDQFPLTFASFHRKSLGLASDLGDPWWTVQSALSP